MFSFDRPSPSFVLVTKSTPPLYFKFDNNPHLSPGTSWDKLVAGDKEDAAVFYYDNLFFRVVPSERRSSLQNNQVLEVGYFKTDEKSKSRWTPSDEAKPGSLVNLASHHGRDSQRFVITNGGAIMHIGDMHCLSYSDDQMAVVSDDSAEVLEFDFELGMKIAKERKADTNDQSTIGSLRKSDSSKANSEKSDASSFVIVSDDEKNDTKKNSPEKKTSNESMLREIEKRTEKEQEMLSAQEKVSAKKRAERETSGFDFKPVDRSSSYELKFTGSVPLLDHETTLAVKNESNVKMLCLKRMREKNSPIVEIQSVCIMPPGSECEFVTRIGHEWFFKSEVDIQNYVCRTVATENKQTICLKYDGAGPEESQENDDPEKSSSSRSGSSKGQTHEDRIAAIEAELTEMRERRAWWKGLMMKGWEKGMWKGCGKGGWKGCGKNWWDETDKSQENEKLVGKDSVIENENAFNEQATSSSSNDSMPYSNWWDNANENGTSHWDQHHWAHHHHHWDHHWHDHHHHKGKKGKKGDGKKGGKCFRPWWGEHFEDWWTQSNKNDDDNNNIDQSSTTPTPHETREIRPVTGATMGTTSGVGVATARSDTEIFSMNSSGSNQNTIPTPGTHCACKNCAFTVNENPQYFKAKPTEDHEYCCTACKRTGGFRHGPWCEHRLYEAE